MDAHAGSPAKSVSNLYAARGYEDREDAVVRSAMSIVAQPRKKSANLSVVNAGHAEPTFAERSSDCWPDWATPLSSCELSKSAARNRPSTVFAEVGKTVAVIAGLVVLAQILLVIFHLN